MAVNIKRIIPPTIVIIQGFDQIDFDFCEEKLSIRLF